jgi:hypothetical protein
MSVFLGLIIIIMRFFCLVFFMHVFNKNNCENNAVARQNKRRIVPGTERDLNMDGLPVCKKQSLLLSQRTLRILKHVFDKSYLFG